ncbi:MAG: hypothetical protein WBO70_04470 [Erysipelotrichaceae bacterium]
MSKRQLKQIKIFRISDYQLISDLEEDVNNYVIERFNKEGNFPSIETNSKFISIISECLVETES